MAKKEFRRGSIRRVLSRIRGSDQGPPFELFRDYTDVFECSKWVRATSRSSSDLFVWCWWWCRLILFFSEPVSGPPKVNLRHINAKKHNEKSASTRHVASNWSKLGPGSSLGLHNSFSNLLVNETCQLPWLYATQPIHKTLWHTRVTVPLESYRVRKPWVQVPSTPLLQFLLWLNNFFAHCLGREFGAWVWGGPEGTQWGVHATVWHPRTGFTMFWAFIFLRCHSIAWVNSK